MIVLAIDREQLRQDIKTAAAYLTLVGLVALYFALLIELLGIIDVVPPIGDKAIGVLMLAFYAYVWRDKIRWGIRRIRQVPEKVHQRYSLEESAGGSGTEDSV